MLTESASLVSSFALENTTSIAANNILINEDTSPSSKNFVKTVEYSALDI